MCSDNFYPFKGQGSHHIETSRILYDYNIDLRLINTKDLPVWGLHM